MRKIREKKQAIPPDALETAGSFLITWKSRNYAAFKDIVPPSWLCVFDETTGDFERAMRTRLETYALTAFSGFTLMDSSVVDKLTLASIVHCSFKGEAVQAREITLHLEREGGKWYVNANRVYCADLMEVQSV